MPSWAGSWVSLLWPRALRPPPASTLLGSGIGARLPLTRLGPAQVLQGELADSGRNLSCAAPSLLPPVSKIWFLSWCCCVCVCTCVCTRVHTCARCSVGRPDGMGAVIWPCEFSSGQMGFVCFHGALLCQVTHLLCLCRGVGSRGECLLSCGLRDG